MKFIFLITMFLSGLISYAQSVRYFKKPDSDEVLKAMIQDVVPEVEKVGVNLSFGGSRKLWKDKNENIFYEITQVFKYPSGKKKAQNALIIFAKYHGEKTDECYRLYDNPQQGASVFYGIYTFEKSKGWYLQKKSNSGFNAKYQNYGQYGNIGTIDLVEFGKEQYALVFSGSGFGQGYTTQYVSYYDIRLELEVFQLLETISTSGVAQDEDAYEYSMTTGFIKSGKDHFDLKVTYKGTHYDDNGNETEPPQIVPYQKTVIYVFESETGKYHQKK